MVSAMTPAPAFPGFRNRFSVPVHGDHDVAYLCGHSLGLQPAGVAEAVQAELQRWASKAVEGHFDHDGWYTYAERLAPSMAAVVGAAEHEVAVLNTLTVNLHFLLASFYKPEGARNRILVEAGSFPSDRYALTTHLAWHAANAGDAAAVDPADALVEVAPAPGEATLGTERIVAAIEEQGEQLSLVLFSGVQYATGERFDLGAITAAAHSVGALAGFDLAHAVGNVPVDLHESDADFAAWCTYKYLNAGPGAVGGLYVHERHALDPHRLRLAGWWGNDPDTRFHMATEREFVPRSNASSWAVSNPPILSMVPLSISLPMFAEAGVSELRERSLMLTGHLEALVADRLGDRVRVVTPTDPERRGAQLSLSVPDATPDLEKRLSASGVVIDFREPDLLRIAPTPMYNTTEDLDRAIEVLAEVLAN